MVWQMTCQRSQMFWCALCSHHVFVLLVSVCFGSFENLSLSDWCRFPSRWQPFTSICLSNFFWDGCLCLSPSLLTLFVIWHSGTTRFKYRFSRADYFVLCIYMPLWFTLGIISSVEGIWLGVLLMRSLVRSHNFFATARKIIYAACSIQAGRFFIGQN